MPSCGARSTAVVCVPCRRRLPSWLSVSRGRTRADMREDVLAFCGAKGTTPRETQWAQSGIIYGKKARGMR